MTDNANPSQDPADDDTLGGTFRMVLRKFLQGTDGMLPAIVIAVDEKRNYATVKPLVMVQATDDTLTARAQIASVPIYTVGAGNYVMSFPIKPGDLGWIIANDRDISLFLQENKEAAPNTSRLHSFEDGVFFPDNARKWTLAGADAEAATWQSLDGTIKVTLGADMIHVVHPTKVEITTPLAHFTGDLTAEGTIRGKTDVLSGAGEISGKTHHHTGVTTGGGNSGGPAN